MPRKQTLDLCCKIFSWWHSSGTVSWKWLRQVQEDWSLIHDRVWLWSFAEDLTMSKNIDSWPSIENDGKGVAIYVHVRSPNIYNYATRLTTTFLHPRSLYMTRLWRWLRDISQSLPFFWKLGEVGDEGIFTANMTQNPYTINLITISSEVLSCKRMYSEGRSLSFLWWGIL